MGRRMFVMLATLLVAAAVCAAPAVAEFHYHSVAGSAFAFWNSCPGVAVGAPCAFTEIEAETARTDVFDGIRERDCVFIVQYRDDSGIVSDRTYANACSAASVLVTASLAHARVTGTIPASKCHFDLATRLETCTPTALEISLDWEGSGDVVNSQPYMYHYSYEPGQRCLQHSGRARRRQAVASGEIAGLPAPLGDLQPELTALFFGGTIIVGTDFGCYD